MAYMNCPRCGLSVYLEAGQTPWDVCPRCWGQAEVAVPIYVADQGLPQTGPAPAGEAASDAIPERRLSLTRARTADGWTVTLEGELDLATFGELDALLGELEPEPGDPGRVVLDLRGLAFLDSTGLGTIAAADLRARHAGRRLELICGDGQVRRLLELTGLDRTLTLV